jgi:hypothetical protein
MIDLIQLTGSFVSTLQAIPELVAVLSNQDPNRIVGYIDENPKRNSVPKALYDSPPGSILIVWTETVWNPNERDTAPWLHRYEVVCRAAKGASPMDMVRLLVNGTPVPGDGQRWLRCGIMAGILPASVLSISRPADQETIDYLVLQTEFAESGDA